MEARVLRRRPLSAVPILATTLVAWAQSAPITDYIIQGWTTLTRSNKNLATAAIDPKFPLGSNGRWPVYVARSENPERVEREMRAQMPAEDFGKIEIRRLPEDIMQ